MNQQLYFSIGTVFTPETPVNAESLFSGRVEQIKSLMRAVSSQGSHAVIFGERGVGKTSLGNTIKYFLPKDNTIPYASFSCQANTTFSDLWRSILSGLFIKIQKPIIGIPHGTTEEVLPLTQYISDKQNITGQEVRLALEQLGTGQCIILIDEVDRLNEETTTTLADTIKMFSDYNVRATLILIGVGDSVGSLIKGHESIERAMIQIKMPPMTEEEIQQIIDKGLGILKMTIEDKVKKKIVALSRGFPHYTHLLMFHAGQNAANNDRTNITENDFDFAVQQSVIEKERSLKDKYDLAIASTKRAFMFIPVILACALAKRDKDGYFALVDIQEPLKKILGKEEVPIAAFTSHIGMFCTAARGDILEKTGKERKYRFRFQNPLMQSFVIMKTLNDKFETKTPLTELIFGKE